MSTQSTSITDANEAVASVAYRMSETIVIYPITPSSPMAELSDEWSNQERPNLWSGVPAVAQMQSEGGRGRRGPRHPAGGNDGHDFHRLAGAAPDDPEHVQDRRRADALLHARDRSESRHPRAVDLRRPLGCHGLPFRPGSPCSPPARCRRRTTWRLIAHAATLRSRVPFLHFFDGFRTSHEVSTPTTRLSDDDLRALIAMSFVEAHHERAEPGRPGPPRHGAEPGCLFPGPGGGQRLLRRLPGIVEDTMERFHQKTGRDYRLFSYTGAEDAERSVGRNGIGSRDQPKPLPIWLNRNGRKTGVLKVRLSAPFPSAASFRPSP